jgi:hypothetical protein
LNKKPKKRSTQSGLRGANGIEVVSRELLP